MTVDASPERGHVKAALDAALDAAVAIASGSSAASDAPDVADALERSAAHLLVAAITTVDREHERAILAVRDEVGACLLAADAAEAADTLAAAQRLRARAVEAVVMLAAGRSDAP